MRGDAIEDEQQPGSPTEEVAKHFNIFLLKIQACIQYSYLYVLSIGILL